MFGRAAAQIIKEREMIRNLRRFLIARSPYPVRSFRIISLSWIISGRRFREAYKSLWIDMDNLILKDFDSLSRVYEFY